MAQEFPDLEDGEHHTDGLIYIIYSALIAFASLAALIVYYALVHGF